MKLVPIKKEEFLPFYQKMEAYFIYDERRDYASSCNVFNHKEFTFYAIEEKNQNIGFISVWECKEFTYIEHFAIDTAYRKRGYGGKAIDMILNRYPFVILEIELPEDEMKKKRLHFYEKHGFVQNHFFYVQPPYHENGNSIPMMILSYPHEIQDEKSVIQELYACVYQVKERN